MSFGEVAAAATRLARDGFPMYPLMADEPRKACRAPCAHGRRARRSICRTARPPETGEVFCQSDLAASLQYMADEEKAAAGRGREAGLEAARDAFYRGDIARQDRRLHEASRAGFFRPRISPSTIRRSARRSAAASAISKSSPAAPGARGRCCCRRWPCSKAPICAALGHNSADYVHHLTEALKLAFADREAYYTDPAMVLGAAADADLVGIRRRAAQADPARPGLARDAAARRSRRDSGARRAARQLAQPVPRARHLLCLRRRPLGQHLSRRRRATAPTARRSCPGPGSSRRTAARNRAPTRAIRPVSRPASGRA